MPEHHQGHARRGGACQHAFRRLDTRQIPDVRDREAEMRIVGEHGRFADGPDIRGAAASEARQRYGIVHGRFRPEILHLLPRQPLGHARAQRLGLPIADKPEGHHPPPDHGIGDPPGLGLVEQQGEFPGQRAGTRAEPGIDAGGIGFGRAAKVGRQGGRLGFRLLQKAEAARIAVEAERHASGKFAHAPGPSAAHEFHLREPVLGVRVAEAERGIGGVPGPDRRHAVAVSKKLNRPLKACQPQFAVELRQGTAQPEQHGADCQNCCNRKSDGEAQYPAPEPPLKVHGSRLMQMRRGYAQPIPRGCAPGPGPRPGPSRGPADRRSRRA